MRLPFVGLAFLSLPGCFRAFSSSRPPWSQKFHGYRQQMQVFSSADSEAEAHLELKRSIQEKVNGNATSAIEELQSLEQDESSTQSTAGEPESLTIDSKDVTDVGSFSTNNSSLPSENSIPMEKKLLYLQSFGAAYSRGEFAPKAEREWALHTIAELEQANPTPRPTLSPLIRGRWELVYASTQLFRSSPFFMAGRAVCMTQAQADQYNWFCDMHRSALAISNIGPVRQIVSDSRLVSEFEVKVGSIPFLSHFTTFRYSGGLPVTVDGAIVSSADLTPLCDGSGWELFMDAVEIKGSNVPGLRQVLDGGLKLQSRSLGDFLEARLPQYRNPRPIFRTTYLDDAYRISRDQDGNAFVYVKTSSEEAPTDYSIVDSDLGVGRLMEGFNDVITKFYW